MAVNPSYGPIINKSAEDPNGTPGQTSGNVPATESRTREAGMPTAGSTSLIPPFNQSPTLNPLDETFAPPVGPMQ